MKFPNTRLGMTLLIYAVLVSTASFSFGISVRRLSLDEMTSLSDRIFLGKVTGVKKQFDQRIGVTVATYSFEVIEGIKGVETGEALTVRQVDAGASRLSILSGMPEYRKGSEVLLFLHGDSRLGLTSPVGQLQGVFREVSIKGRGKGYLNGVGNRNLIQVSEKEPRSQALAAVEREISDATLPMPLSLDSIREMVIEAEESAAAAGGLRK